MNISQRYTDRVRKVIESANSEAERMGHNYLGTEHILLGLLEQKDSVAESVLREFGGEQIRERVLQMLGKEGMIEESGADSQERRTGLHESYGYAAKPAVSEEMVEHFAKEHAAAEKIANLDIFTRTIACHLYAEAVAEKTALGGTPTGTFYEKMAIFAVERAKAAAPFLAKALEGE